MSETSPVEPIPPYQARLALEQAIRETLGEDWDDEEQGWVRVTGHDYMARLTKGRVNVDFYVDLLGNVTVEKSTIGPQQQVGRILALLLMLLAVAIAILIARIAGVQL